MSPIGFKYFVTFVDDLSYVTWLYLMNSRSELFSHFTAFCTEIQTQFHLPVQILRSDNAKKNIYLNLFNLSCYNTRFSIKPLVWIHPLRIG